MFAFVVEKKSQIVQLITFHTGELKKKNILKTKCNSVREKVFCTLSCTVL